MSSDSERVTLHTLHWTILLIIEMQEKHYCFVRFYHILILTQNEERCLENRLFFLFFF